MLAHVRAFDRCTTPNINPWLRHDVVGEQEALAAATAARTMLPRKMLPVDGRPMGRRHAVLIKCFGIPM